MADDPLYGPCASRVCHRKVPFGQSWCASCRRGRDEAEVDVLERTGMLDGVEQHLIAMLRAAWARYDRLEARKTDQGEPRERRQAPGHRDP